MLFSLFSLFVYKIDCVNVLKYTFIFLGECIFIFHVDGAEA